MKINKTIDKFIIECIENKVEEFTVEQLKNAIGRKDITEFLKRYIDTNEGFFRTSEEKGGRIGYSINFDETKSRIILIYTKWGYNVMLTLLRGSYSPKRIISSGGWNEDPDDYKDKTS